MRIGGFECPGILRPGQTVIAQRDGRSFVLGMCGRTMNRSRAEAVTRFLGETVIEGANLAVPEVFEAVGGWYAATPCRQDMHAWFPARYLACFPRESRMTYLLTALAAVLTLTRAGAVHGTLSSDSFRLSVTPEGYVRAVLTEGLAEIGFDGKQPLGFSREEWLRAPEIRSGRGPVTDKADVYSLGMCCHLWMTGEYPRLADTSDTPLMLSQAIVQKQRNVIWAMLQTDPARRIGLREALLALRDQSNIGSSCPSCYFDAGPAKEERDLIMQALDL